MGTLAVVAVVGFGLGPRDSAAGASLLALPALHEAARIVAWRRLGVVVRRLELTVFGGGPELVEATAAPRAETLAALTGLGTLLGLGAMLALGEAVAEQRQAPSAVRAALDSLPPLWWVGAFALLQAMPALPLDGGRVLRAWVGYLADDALVGTRVATFAAHLVGAGLIVLGLTLLFLDRRGTVPYWGLWAVVAGWQVAAVARAELRRGRWQRASRVLNLGDAVSSRARRLPAATPIADALDLLLATGPDAALLVTGDGDQAIGALRIGDLRRARRADWDRRVVADVMLPIAAIPRLTADFSVFDAVERLMESGHPLAVVERDGEPIAVVTKVQLDGPLPERPDVEQEPPPVPDDPER